MKTHVHKQNKTVKIFFGKHSRALSAMLEVWKYVESPKKRLHSAALERNDLRRELGNY